MNTRYVFYTLALLAMLALAGSVSAASSQIADENNGWTSPPPTLVAGDGDVGQWLSLAVVAGHPAMSYFDATNGDLKYVRALDATGAIWGAPVVVDDSVENGRSHLVVIHGNPSIAYFTSQPSSSLKYTRSLDGLGETWAAPLTIAAPADSAPPSIATVNGHPAITYGNAQGALIFNRAVDANGDFWGSGVEVDGVDVWGTALVVVDGAPAIAYADWTNFDLRYVRSADADGVSWATPVILESDGMTGYWPSMAVIAGRPAIAYSSVSSSKLKYVRALDSMGATWGGAVVVDNFYGMWASLSVVNGMPAISYYETAPFNIRFVRSWDGEGKSWRPPLDVVAPGFFSEGVSSSLAMVNGQPGIAYYQAENGDLMYVRADNPSGTRLASTPGLYQGQAGVPVSLDGSASTGTIAEYAWDCTDDGAYDTFSSSPTGAACTYPAEGRYTVRLRVTEVGGLTDEDTADVIVAAGPATGADCAAQTDIPQAECEALVALYDSTDGSNWSDSPGNDWNVTQTPCSWAGVYCNADTPRRVFRVERVGRNLTGRLPDLTSLSRLEHLNLDYNHMSGSIPGPFAFGDLETLTLRDNQLSGEIPDLSALTRLRVLDLGGNRLSGSFPPSLPANLEQLQLDTNELGGPLPDLTALTRLQTLNLANNQLNGSIPNFAPLTSLQHVLLWNNQFSGSIPPRWPPGLKELSLSDNLLTGPIPDLSALTNLEHLNLGHNQLTGSVPNLSSVTHLWSLYLYDNHLSGPIPDLSGLSGLRILDLSGNPLGGGIPDFTALSNLQWLFLSRNQLSGPIHTAFPTGLQYLNLSENQLTGAIPDLTALTNLQSLVLSGNQLRWPVHTSLPNSLDHLDLSGNLLSGSIPDLSGLTSLRSLDLGRNQLSGPIPTSLPPNLVYLTLSDNQISGNLPPVLPASLTYIWLWNNQLTGSIPDLSALTNLEFLNLGLNRYGGAIPDLSALTNLKGLYLHVNQLSGTIPDLSALTNLHVLQLASNQLSGSIPDLSALANLDLLDLSSNQLSGSIPDLSALVNLDTLALSGNRLSGGIPDLSALAKLIQLNVDSNQLSGPIPDLSALTHLRYLVLSANQLSGPIPDLSGLTELEYLSLYSNKLTGPIPDLSALTQLQILMMGNNHLDGSVPDLSGLANLQWVDLHDNHLNGAIPDTLPPSLQYLDLGVNQLSGAIPDFSVPTSLNRLFLHSNQLDGVVPAWLCDVDLYVSLSHNKFTAAADPCVYDTDPAWTATQTVPPQNVQAWRPSPTGAELTWQPILYTGDGGRYEAWCGAQSGGPYTLFGITADKLAAGLTLTGLASATPYYCVVRTYTPAHGDQQNDLTSIDSAEVMVLAGGAAPNLLKPEGWRFWAGAAGGGGAMAEGVMAIDVTSGPARACWFQDIDGADLRNQTVRLGAEMRKTAVMNQANPPFTNPYISLQILKTDSVWLNNYGGVLNSRSVAGGPWVGEARDILLPADMLTLRAAFCVWNATPGLAQARAPFLYVTAPPPPADNLLTSNWLWAPATSGIGSSRSGGTLRIDAVQTGARGCWYQDLAGASLQGKIVYYKAAMSKSADMNAPYGFANPYISLQVRRANGAWDYNYPRNTTLNATAVPGGGFVTEARKYLLPADMVTLRASFCVWDAAPGLAQGKDFLLRLAATTQGEEAAVGDRQSAWPDTPSILPGDAVVQPEALQRLWLPAIRNQG